MYGTHPALVFVHGFLGGSAQWVKQSQALQSDYQVITIDLPGYGKKYLQQAPVRIEAFAHAVLAELSQLGVTTFHLVGHSMGGMIAQAIVEQAPKRIHRLVLYSTGAVGSLPGRFEPIAESIRRAKIDGAKVTGQRIASHWFLQGARAKNFHVCAELAAVASLQAVLAGLEAMGEWSGMAQLSAINQPALVLWGDSDATYTWHQTEQLWQHIKRSQLAVMPHCGHVAHLEKPSLFNAVLMDFLQSDNQ